MKQFKLRKTVTTALAGLLFFLILSITACETSDQRTIDLSGEWQFKMDPGDQGIKDRWYESDFTEKVILPGSMVENGKGNDITLETHWTGGIKNPGWTEDVNYAPYLDPDNVRFPFWLQPLRKYTGAAWYLKTVNIPENWNDKTLTMKLERPHWESQLWVNGEWVDMQNSLAVPHVFDVTEYFTAGDNTIALRIDNRVKEIDPGINSHSITDHTQSNWNGIVGEISLVARDRIVFENVQIFPDSKTKTAEIAVTVNNSTGDKQSVEITTLAKLKNDNKKLVKKTATFTLTPGDNNININYSLGEDALLWDEFNPNVYQLELTLEAEEETDKTTVDFGLRDLSVDGTRIAINGNPVFFRGTLECAIFPLTGYPPTNTDYWNKIFIAVKNHGLNHVRFHSWCPPRAAFVAADSLGIYLMVECSSWANQSTELGSGLPIDQFIWDESKHIVKTYGNHPSFVLMAYGNEPGGSNRDQFLAEFVSYWKGKDARRLYTSGAGWPLIPENEYHVTHREARIQGWGEELNSVINAEPPKTTYDWSEKVRKEEKPVISHEIGQWCVYPDFKEIEKYKGVLKPKNFELFRESLNAHHMGDLADDFVMASGKLQALCYKADIEAALRTPGFAGFQLLDLHDFPGQGTALIGVLDPFWEEKGYITPEEYRRFCNTTVPLARLDKRVFTEGETMTANIEVAHFGEQPLKKVNPSWQITSNDEVLYEASFGQQDIPIGNGIQLGDVNYEFQVQSKPRKLTLEVRIGSFENSWDVWVYPVNRQEKPDGIEIVESLDAATIEYLENGGKVLLSLGKGKVAPQMGGDIGVGFSSIFWNTAWTGGQKPHTLGILCDPEHPALELFPTEYHSNWQWWDAMSHSDAIQLDTFSEELRPIVRIIDDWVSNRRLALLLEAKVGEGSILISGVDLVNDLENRPEARQLLTSLKNYMTADSFNPSVNLIREELKGICR